MDFRNYNRLNIGGYELTRLTTLDGMVLFSKNKSPLPDSAYYTIIDGSSMMPNSVYCAQYDNGQLSASFQCPVYRTTATETYFMGSSGSVVGYVKITKDEGNNPTRIVNILEVGNPPMQFTPVDGYGISVSDANQQKTYYFTNPVSSTQTQRITARYNDISTRTEIATLNDMVYISQDGTQLLTIGDNYVGYSSELFGNDSTYDFKEHSGETFTLSNGFKSISFIIK